MYVVRSVSIDSKHSEVDVDVDVDTMYRASPYSYKPLKNERRSPILAQDLPRHRPPPQHS